MTAQKVTLSLINWVSECLIFLHPKTAIFSNFLCKKMWLRMPKSKSETTSCRQLSPKLVEQTLVSHEYHFWASFGQILKIAYLRLIFGRLAFAFLAMFFLYKFCHISVFSVRSDFAVSDRPHSFALPSIYRFVFDLFSQPPSASNQRWRTQCLVNGELQWQFSPIGVVSNQLWNAWTAQINQNVALYSSNHC